MPLVVPVMEPKSYNHAIHSARDAPVTLQSLPAALCGSTLGSPSAPATIKNPNMGSMNYSPRHSRGPSSLLNSRNINIGRLLVTSTPSQASPGVLPPRRGIPSSLYPPRLSQAALQTPKRAFMSQLPALHEASRSCESNGSFRVTPSVYGSLFDRSFRSRLRSPFDTELPGSMANFQDDLSRRLLDLRVLTPGRPSPADADSLPSNEEAIVRNNAQTHSGIGPEELQETALTDAYPQGPANVLNSVLYLYSDPRNSELPVNINDYDLVVNVARECEDLSVTFDTKNGTKQYLRVPWTHVSKILKDLSMITSAIAAADKPGNKILIHCQCGVLRSACVVVAYFMVKFKISVNEAYELLKMGSLNLAEPCTNQIREAGNYVEACERICPNMSLIFELMDFRETLNEEST